MILYGFPHKLLVKLASFFLKAKSLCEICLNIEPCWKYYRKRGFFSLR